MTAANEIFTPRNGATLLIGATLAVPAVSTGSVGFYGFAMLLLAPVLVGCCVVLLLDILIVSNREWRRRRQRTLRGDGFADPDSSRSADAAIAIARRWLWTFLVFLLTQVGGLVASHHVHDRHVDEAKAWCEGVAGLIEARRASGEPYPKSLGELTIQERPPELCRNFIGYQNKGDSFTIDFASGETFFAAWVYDSSTRRWTWGT